MTDHHEQKVSIVVEPYVGSEEKHDVTVLFHCDERTVQLLQSRPLAFDVSDIVIPLSAVPALRKALKAIVKAEGKK